MGLSRELCQNSQKQPNSSKNVFYNSWKIVNTAGLNT